METKEKNKLHELISGLTVSDKSYLKKYSKIFNAKGETIHKIYYTVLEKMDIYSIEELKRKLEKYGGARRFKNAEQEIYSQILEDLVVLKSKKRPTWQYYMEHMKLGYLFLSDKYEEAMKQFDVLEKIKDKAKNSTIDYLYHKFHYHHLASVNMNRTPEETAKVVLAEEELRMSLQNVQLEFLLEAASLNFDSYRFNTYNKSRSDFIQGLKPFTQKYVDVLPKSLVTNKWKTLSLYYHFFSNYYKKLADLEQFDIYSKQYYDEFKVDKIRNQFHLAYINALYFRISYLVQIKNNFVYTLLAEFKLYLTKGEKLESKSLLHAMYCQCGLYALVSLGNKKALEDFVKTELNVYQNDLKSSTIRIVLATDLRWAAGMFIIKKYKDAQMFLDKIFNAIGKIKESSNSILIATRLLDILIHFELGNYENINYYINNLEKEIIRRNQWIQFDKDFFGHLRKLNQQLFAKEKPDIASFVSFLESNEENDRVESYLTVIDIKRWLETL